MEAVRRAKAASRRIARLLRKQSLILMYHRVATSALDPWSLQVSPRRFAEHLAVLEDNYRVVSLRTLAGALRTGRPLERAVAISFDDGYVDNFLNARPLLEAAGMHATVFIVTAHLESEREFWWDELERLVLECDDLPETLSLDIGGERRSWAVDLEPETGDRDPCRLRAWEGAPRSRMALYHAIWESMLRLPTAEQQAVLAELRSLTGQSAVVRSTHRTMTVEELNEMARSDAIEIGAHTVNHPYLTAHPEASQRHEIEHSKATLQAILDRDIGCFAYPFGEHDRVSARIVRASGFACACTTVEDTVWRRSNPFLLPRFAVGDWTGDEFAERLRQLMG